MKNEKAKTRKVNNPYEIYIKDGWEWRVLKHYQGPDKEQTNPYARVFTAVHSPFVSSYEMGDTYLKDIVGEPLAPKQVEEHLSNPNNKWREF